MLISTKLSKRFQKDWKRLWKTWKSGEKYFFPFFILVKTNTNDINMLSFIPFLIFCYFRDLHAPWLSSSPVLPLSSSSTSTWLSSSPSGRGSLYPRYLCTDTHQNHLHHCRRKCKQIANRSIIRIISPQVFSIFSIYFLQF